MASLGDRAQEFVRDTRRRVDRFVREQQLEAKAAAAGRDAQKKLTSAYEEAQENLRRSYMQLDSEYDLQGKAGRATRRAQEAVADIDQQFSVRRRLRTATDDLLRRVPVWRRQLGELSATSSGKATLTLLFVLLLTSGAIWKLVNLAWLLCWISVPVSLFIADQSRRAASEQAGGSGAGASAGNSARTWGSWQQQQQQQQQPWNQQGSGVWGSRQQARQQPRPSQQGGPVVDAEWTSLDEK